MPAPKQPTDDVVDTTTVDDTTTTTTTDETTPDLLAEITAAVESADPVSEDGEEEADVAAKPDKPEGDTPAADVVDPDTPDPAAAAAPDKTKEPDAAVEKEIADLGLKGKSQERFRALTGEVKALSQEVEVLRGSHAALEQWQGALKSTKATPEDLGSALEILHHANTGTIEGAKQALAMVDEFRSNLAQRFGIDVAGVDHLAGFDDLKQKVADGDLTADGAREIASARRLRTIQENERKAQDNVSTQEQAIATAGADVDALCAQLKQSDPLYAQKYAQVKAMIPVIARTIPPAKWKETFKTYYDAVQVQPVRDSRREAPVTDPIRSSPGGGGKPAPKSALEAVSQALGL